MEATVKNYRLSHFRYPDFTRVSKPSNFYVNYRVIISKRFFFFKTNLLSKSCSSKPWKIIIYWRMSLYFTPIFSSSMKFISFNFALFLFVFFFHLPHWFFYILRSSLEDSLDKLNPNLDRHKMWERAWTLNSDFQKIHTNLFSFELDDIVVDVCNLFL